ncbi:BnaCnng70580D [Brassica napus]|uniref:BnaCnng70580D protein n=1 Tax=Brassica napus TaxID=3708 RepID=A0A078JTR1_BRANA|nr:BnaCnng70580D [Brassica napus]
MVGNHCYCFSIHGITLFF